ncbi:MAG TPA: S1C family serine protease [Pyrinomonadaceae bacterium]|jgi:S1-C subfamily serine protease|nr:S1C family serine protease [Pyrinomonadaceae bacterium]
MDSTNSETGNPLVALSRFLAEAVERVSPRVVAVDARPRVHTSGVLWRPGVVVSTNHTIRRDEEITVTLSDGSRRNATLAGRDPGTDLAVLRIEGEEAGGADSATQFAEASALKVGSLVLAVGRAHPDQGVSASLGIVSVTGDRWRTWRGGEIDRLIRPDVSVFIGFSGGALLDAEGRITGINTTGLARGAGVTIPAPTVDRVVDQLLASGRIARPYLGVGMHPVLLPTKLREQFNLPYSSGLMMLSVEADAPADKAGITIGDVLVALGEDGVADTNDVQRILGREQVGAVIRARFLRGGEIKEADITLGERPVRKR